MKRVLPEVRFVQLDGTHPIFNSFFEIKNLEFLQSYNEPAPTYWGMFEDNDPKKRLIAIANRDNDLGEYWEYSDTGYGPDRFLERSVQVRRELFHLRVDAVRQLQRNLRRHALE